MIKIDGSYGEGGGQILRNAAAFATILGRDLNISQIRVGRANPGLRRQHLTGLQLLSDYCGGRVAGNTIGSQEIVFQVSPNDGPVPRATCKSATESTILTGDTKTAGSICLLLQAALPSALVGRRPMRWILKGGTNASHAPQIDYWQLVFLPMFIHHFRVPPENIHTNIACRGFFPKGGGEVHVDTTPLPLPLPAINVTERGAVVSVLIRSIYSGRCPRNVAATMASAAKAHLEQNINVPDIRVEICHGKPAVASGSGIIIVATTSTGCRFGGTALGLPSKPPREVGMEAAVELCATLSDGGCVDEYLQDQFIIYMALAEGSSEMITGSLTLHTRTAIWTAEQCCGAQFQVTRLDTSEHVGSILSSDHDTGRIYGKHKIRCTGIGMR